MQCASVISDTLSRIKYRQEITSIKRTKRTFHAVWWFVKNKTSFSLTGTGGSRAARFHGLFGQELPRGDRRAEDRNRVNG